MSKPDKSIDPRILKSAKEEFLSQGYEKASLKTICANAKVTTGALYKRYKSKEELFTAVVTPTLEALNEVADNRRINFDIAIMMALFYYYHAHKVLPFLILLTTGLKKCPSILMNIILKLKIEEFLLRKSVKRNFILYYLLFGLRSMSHSSMVLVGSK